MSSNASSATYFSQPHDTEKQAKQLRDSDSLSRVQDPYEVDLTPDEHPQNMSTARKWLIVLVISLASLCVTCSSSAAAFAEGAMAEEFHVSRIVTILTVSLFVVGLGVGPLVAGPLSEVYGRNIIYRVSFTLLFVFSWPIVFAPDIAVMLVFRFLSGLCGSTFLSVAGGTVSDLFTNETVANPMSLYTLSPFIGPVIGPLYSGFANQNASWRWTFRVLLIWTFVQTVALYILVPETYVPVLRKRKAAKLRKTTGDSNYWAPLDHHNKDLMKSILVSCYKPFELIFYDRMVLLLNTWTALILGILYLTFQAFPIIFQQNHGFSMQQTGMTFLGIGLGMILAMPTQGYFNRFVNATKTPESHLHKAEFGGILIPLGLWILAFTTYPHVHWIVPIIASIPFGAGIYLVFTSVFTFLVTAYRPIAASTMASNSAMRSGFAAAFPLFAGFMYDALGTVGATALLAGIMTVMAPLPFIFRRIGARLRQNSRFAAQS
ncbi:hypothetical protein Moror_2609 [Moniliophthora roreri MCA 2997]|uniref:Major facilitator superfamily (MFS) profile domain-containing protein n=1 Tax=Moniliophthora roreri (strain MCA 2997) TaxID=1381753 RepID=V2XCN1_MONRO|nr:hypothetical protein Moror_2609 [Moniliophthora roreri MCA 2997]